MQHELNFGAPRFDAKAHARIGDPTTSHHAAASMRDAARALIGKIEAELRANGPGTYEQIAARAGLRPDQVWRRLSDMEDLGLARPNGSTRRGSLGRQQRVWSAT